MKIPVHPTALIGPGVSLGTGVIVGPYSVIAGDCEIGDRTWIGPHVTIGAPAEMRGWEHPPLEVTRTLTGSAPARDETKMIRIGADCVIREFTAIQASTERQTIIGDRAYIMDKVHIPHDAWIGNDVTIACGTMLGGHVTIGDFANIGLNSTIHQRRSVGPLTMVGMGSVVTRDLPGCIKAFGSPARAHGVNIVGMERQGFSAESIRKVVMDSDQDVSISPDESWPTHIAQSWEMFMSAVTEKTMK